MMLPGHTRPLRTPPGKNPSQFGTKWRLVGLAGWRQRLMFGKDKQRQRDLFESERNFRLLVEGVTDYALYMLDPDGIITSWNIGGQRIKG